MTTHPPIPCPDCSGMLHLKEKPRSWRGGSGFVYLCENWPQCRGLMSAHADGRPCGNPADAYTRKARSMVQLFDPLWSDAPSMYGPDCPLTPDPTHRPEPRLQVARASHGHAVQGMPHFHDESRPASSRLADYHKTQSHAGKRPGMGQGEQA